MDTPTLIHAAIAALVTLLGGVCLGAAEVLRRLGPPALVLALTIPGAAADGTSRCDDARRAALKAVEAAWMQEPEPKAAINFEWSPRWSALCECGDCTTLTPAIHYSGGTPSRGSAYYECKAEAARKIEAAQKAQREAEEAQRALEDAAREAMYRLRDACGEGPRRPKPASTSFYLGDSAGENILLKESK